VNLGVLRQSNVVYLKVIESTQPLRRIVSATMVDPFACTALGRAIVAFLPEKRQAHLLQSTPLQRRTPHSIVDPDQLRQLLEQVRVQGYATEENETDLGVMCIGAPISDGTSVVAAVSLSAPTVRMDPETRQRSIDLVKQTAAEISRRLVRQRDASATNQP
jgi:DNA-binding IclR family transcriptional regulator